MSLTYYDSISSASNMVDIVWGIEVNGLDINNMTERLPQQYFGDKIFKKSGNSRQNGQNLAILFSRVGQ